MEPQRLSAQGRSQADQQRDNSSAYGHVMRRRHRSGYDVASLRKQGEVYLMAGRLEE